MSKILIVGAGASARIAKIFYPSAEVIAPTIINNPFFYLWYTKNVEKFLKDFDISYELKTITNIKIGVNVEKYNKLTFKPIDSKPSMGFSKIKVVDIKDSRLTKIEINHKDLVKSINVKRGDVVLSSGKHVKFDLLIWTAPINLVLDNCHYSAKYSPIAFMKYVSSHEIFAADYCYTFLDSFLDVGIYRISKNKNIYTFEVARAISNMKRAELFISIVFPYLKHKSTFVYSTGHIVNKVKIPRAKNILFLGRNAQMNRKILIKDVIKKLYEVSKHEERHLWNKRKR